MQTKQAYPPPAGATPFSGAYGDLTGKPTLGTCADNDTGTGVGNIPLINASSRIPDALGDVRSVPQNAQTAAYVLVASDAGKHISITTGGVTINTGVHAVGDVVSIFNNSASSQTITQGASVTLHQAGTANTGDRTLAQYGVATVLCVASGIFVISGAGLS